MDIYEDIRQRTNGEIYMGVVGPVRTGKSTFIKNFMELMVLPQIKDEFSKSRAIDEMPQASDGVTIMTTEPKFVPKNAVEITIGNLTMKVRLIDCVGFLIDGAYGSEENGIERNVKTPWFSYDIPFSKAAEIGTNKVITDHSTVGIVVSCDGSINDITRESYYVAEKQAVNELKKLGKPYVLILNSKHPEYDETIELAKNLEEEYGITVLPIDCYNLDYDDIHNIFESLLYAFPVKEICFDIPKWVEAMDIDYEIKATLIEYIKCLFEQIVCVNDLRTLRLKDCDIISNCVVDNIDMAQGKAKITINLLDSLYYDMLSKLFDVELHNEYDFATLLSDLAKTRRSFMRVNESYNEVCKAGYSFLMPDKDDIAIEEPKLIKTGNKYGVKLKAQAPSIHLIKANVTTEIAPIVGSYEQAKDLIDYISEDTENKDNIWNVNIFGKSIRQLVDDGMRAKITRINEESKSKLQDTMDKIVNDSNGGLVCIII